LFLTVGSRRARMRRRSALGGKQAAEAVGGRGEAAAEVLRASGLREPIRGAPVEVTRGVRKARSAPVAGNQNAAGTYRRWSTTVVPSNPGSGVRCRTQGALRMAAATWGGTREVPGIRGGLSSLGVRVAEPTDAAHPAGGCSTTPSELG
jgi:hypothetical protein